MVEGPIAVIGGSGFVGRHLMARLQRAGMPFVGTSRQTSRDRQAVDVTDPTSVKRFIQASAPTVVVHLAALAHRSLFDTGVEAFDAVNRRGTENVISASRENGVGRVIYMSSASVYGPGSDVILDESTEPKPVGAYARSKWQGELACGAVRGVETVILRPPAIYSREWLLNVRKRAYVPGLRPRTRLLLVGTPLPRFSLCSIENLLEAIMMGIGGILPSETYNVADDASYSQAEIAELVGQFEGVRRNLRLPVKPLRLALGALGAVLPGGMGRFVDANADKLLRGLVLDTSRIARLGFSGTASLEATLDRDYQAMDARRSIAQ